MKYAIELSEQEIRLELIEVNKVLMSIRNSRRLKNLPTVDRRREYTRLDRMMTAVEMTLDKGEA